MENINTNQFKNVAKKRGCNIIRNRCLQFIAVLKQNGYANEIPLETAKELFITTMGIMDRASLKAYFGSQAGRTIRKIQKVTRYSTGTMSYKTIELAQQIPQKRGYFELLGLAKLELRGSIWFMVLLNEPLVPELFPQHYERNKCSKEVLSHHNEGEKLPIENFSLSPILQGKECEKTVLKVASPNIEQENKQTTTYRMRERNDFRGRFLTLNGEKHNEYASICLTPEAEAEALLNAVPLEKEPDRAKIQWKGGSY